MCRWWFVPNYECVRVADDELAMQLVGEGVKLVGADEVVLANGQRQAAGHSNLASKAWCEQFTKQYAKISDAKPIYGQLRNLVDLSIAAAFIQQQDYFAKIGWAMDLFRNEGQLPVQTCIAPKQVETAINVIYKGNGFSTPIGGGVTIDPRAGAEIHQPAQRQRWQSRRSPQGNRSQASGQRAMVVGLRNRQQQALAQAQGRPG